MCMCVYHRHIHDNTHRESKTSDADTMRTKSLQCSFLLFLSPLSLFHLSFTRFYSTLSSSLSVPLYLSLYVSFFPFSMSFNFSPPLSHLLYICLYFLPLIPLSPSFYRYFSSFSRLVFFLPSPPSLSLPPLVINPPSLTPSRKANKPCRRKLYSCFRSVSSFLAPIYISFCPFPILSSSKLFPLSPFLVLW